jgi:YD repeat-containing protein
VLRFLKVTTAIVAGVALALGALIWTGPLLSGAIFLTARTNRKSAPHDLEPGYEPRHKGHVDVSTGLYVREDEDVIMSRTPPFLLTRTYLSGYHASRHFGVGTTSNAEWYLIGDPARFQWAELILANGGRIRFDRTSRGTSYEMALFRHQTTPTSFYGSQLGWTGLDWTLRFSDGALARFRGCGPGANDACSLMLLRDDDNHSLRFRRDSAGRLLSIEGPTERMQFQYDDRQRVIAADVDGQQPVEYEYDEGGRLVRVRSAGGVTREYSYGPRDEMLTIREPGWFIENTFDAALRVVRQVTHWDPTPAVPRPKDAAIAFAYIVSGEVVTETDTLEYDGSHTVYRFNSRHYPDVEIHDATGANPMILSIDRDASGQFVTGLTVRCTVNGRRTTRTVPMSPQLGEEEAKEQLITSTCRPAPPAATRR